MTYQVVFVRAGNGSPEECQQVAEQLVARFGVPSETAIAMVQRAPVAVKRGIPLAEAESYRVALESIGVVAAIEAEEPPPPSSETVRRPPAPPVEVPVAPSVEVVSVAPTPAFTPGATADWWAGLRVLNPPHDEPRRGASPLTAGRIRASGAGVSLAHPMVSRLDYAEAEIVTAFRVALNGKVYVDVFPPPPSRPIRLDSDFINFESFSLPESEDRLDQVAYLIRFLLQQNPATRVDLATYRFLRDPEQIKTVQTERDVEKYCARLIADLETAADLNVIAGHDAEELRDAEDPWIPPPPPPPEPPPFLPPPGPGDLLPGVLAMENYPLPAAGPAGSPTAPAPQAYPPQANPAYASPPGDSDDAGFSDAEMDLLKARSDARTALLCSGIGFVLAFVIAGLPLSAFGIYKATTALKTLDRLGNNQAERAKPTLALVLGILGVIVFGLMLVTWLVKS